VRVYRLFIIRIIFVLLISWILSQLRFADKDKSNKLTKHECRKVFTNSLNVELAEDVLEKLFKVTQMHFYYSLPFYHSESRYKW
jgi:hypothetical protein